MRNRHHRLAESVDYYEKLVAQQAAQLIRMNSSHKFDFVGDEVEDGKQDPHNVVIQMTKEDLRKEEEEIRQLETKKRSLEDRVSGMEKDLGGLMR